MASATQRSADIAGRLVWGLDEVGSFASVGAADCRPASLLAAGATDSTGAGGDCAHSALNMVMASESGRSFGIAASAASTTRPGTSSPERIVRRTMSFALAATVAPDGSLGSSYVFPAPLERRGTPYSSISLRMPEEVDPSREAMTTVERRASRAFRASLCRDGRSDGPRGMTLELSRTPFRLQHGSRRGMKSDDISWLPGLRLSGDDVWKAMTSISAGGPQRSASRR